MNEEQNPRVTTSDILNAMRSEAPIIIGFSPRGPVMEPFEIKRWGQFIVKYGSFKKCGYLATSIKGFFINGGKRCYVLNLGERPEDVKQLKERYEAGLKSLDTLDDIPFIIAPGENEPEIHDVILGYCDGKETFALLDGPEELVEKIKEAEEGEESEAVEDDSTQSVESEDFEDMEKYENLPEIKGNKGIVIYPWIYLKDRVLGDFFIPPTGHAAGIFSKLYSNNERPEFSTIEGTIYLKYKFSPEEIEQYAGRGISSLRYPTKKPALMFI